MSQPTAPTSGSKEPFVDYYEVLQVSLDASDMQIALGFRARVRELANPNSELSLSDRARLCSQVKIAFQVLRGFRSRFQYDIVRMMNRGELSLANPYPAQQDLPSRGIARTRFVIAFGILKKTLHTLIKTFDFADCQMLWLRKKHVEAKNMLQQALNQIRLFWVHLTMQLEACKRALVIIDEMSNDAWAYGIRDPRVDSQTGRLSLAKRTLQKLHVAEMHIHQHYWPQIARQLDNKDDYEQFEYPKRLLRILGHLRY